MARSEPQPDRADPTLGRCLVFGGAGWTGRALVDQLCARGLEVDVADLADYAGAHASVRAHRCDVSDADAVARVFAAVEPDTVFHLASMIDIRPAPSPKIEAVNVGGTRTILRCASEGSTARLIYTASIDVVWGGRPFTKVDERQAYPPSHPHAYATTKTAAEREVLAASSERLRTVSLRPSHIYGPGDDVLHMVGSVPFRFGRREDHMSFVYVDNCAHAHVLAAQALARSGEVSGRAYFLADFDANFYDTYRSFLDRGITRVGLPSAVLRSLTAGTDALARLAHARLGWQVYAHPKRVLSVAAVQAAESSTVDSSRATRELGYTPLVSREEALRRTRAWATSPGADPR